ncbi:WhiB family transcriptional regulator [Pseudonocardia parietis]|jgi:WhiB family redox-sensing transcriptional regulator|uniref:Transcriptional regulator WhiB n=1 Tax=Pseudonocardia parietis TaxID=570936 RepID=A0ABS4W132_9PSEU|nr:WhiB family transcriptional regulator [Pseudonocardia parietis]MBP2369916.1 WhiB family redox-sensing transcriptional regulator [Pseudonocardia parietis]
MSAAEVYAALFGGQVDPDWEAYASCREVDADLFFPEERESAGRVKAICRSCSVRDECLATAIRRGESHGIWGGMTARERGGLARSLRDDGFAVPRAARRPA